MIAAMMTPSRIAGDSDSTESDRHWHAASCPCQGGPSRWRGTEDVAGAAVEVLAKLSESADAGPAVQRLTGAVTVAAPTMPRRLPVTDRYGF